MWYNHNKRELPWRETSNAYHIWVSEIILQQTQIVTGLNYYQRIINRFPNVMEMALAPEDELLKLWQGMGYYTRARNMHATARMIAEKFNGQFPDNYQDIASLKGIGSYTAAAIASIAFNLPHAVVDGNVYRVLSRLFAIDTPIDSTEGKKEFQQIATELLDNQHPALHNQAVMELGALVCKPANPDCQNCPIKDQCIANQQNNTDNYPVKSKKIVPTKRYLTFVLIQNQHHLYISKRVGKDIWHGLYQLPMIEHNTQPSDNEIIQQTTSHLELTPQQVEIKNISHQKHQLTHQTLHINFVQMKGELNQSDYIKINISDLHQYAFPKPIERYFKKLNLE